MASEDLLRKYIDEGWEGILTERLGQPKQVESVDGSKITRFWRDSESQTWGVVFVFPGGVIEISSLRIGDVFYYAK